MAVVSTAEFKAKQKMKPITFKSTDEYRRLVEYKKLKSSPDVKKYLGLVGKGKKDEADSLSGAPSISRYLELDTVVRSKDFIEKQNMKPVTFKDTEEYKLLQEFNNLRNSQDIKFYYKFAKSSELANFNQVDGSQKLARYEELKEYLATPEFKERKEYLLDKKRFEKSDLFTQEQEYLKLKKSENIVWYFKVKDSDKFNILKERKLTFSDEFEADALDTKKWLTNHYWGDKLLHDRYSLETDLHCYTEKDNFEVRSGHLKIITKAQKAEGKVWNPTLGGFRTKEFEFTSGVINPGKSFRQKYGVFSAKIKLTTGSGPRHAFWMLGEKITPHIDICRTDKGKVWMDYFADGAKGIKSAIGSRYCKDFFIFTLEWTPEMLVWKINGVEVCRQTSNLPQEEMYLIFSGGLDKPMHGSSAMEIDWVRVYQWNKN
ncbi:MAG: glycoside hydrolase family 16 protein [Bacteroidales bacterium]